MALARPSTNQGREVDDLRYTPGGPSTTCVLSGDLIAGVRPATFTLNEGTRLLLCRRTWAWRLPATGQHRFVHVLNLHVHLDGTVVRAEHQQVDLGDADLFRVGAGWQFDDDRLDAYPCMDVSEVHDVVDPRVDGFGCGEFESLAVHPGAVGGAEIDQPEDAVDPEEGGMLAADGRRIFHQSDELPLRDHERSLRRDRLSGRIPELDSFRLACGHQAALLPMLEAG